MSVNLRLASADIAWTNDGPVLRYVFQYDDGRDALKASTPITEEEYEAIRIYSEQIAPGKTLVEIAEDLLARRGAA